MSSKLTLKASDYEAIEKSLTEKGFLKGAQDYAVVTQRIHGRFHRSIHVFERHPTTKEYNDYEQTASRVESKGRKVKIEGSKVLAGRDLYDKIILAVFDLPVGRQILGRFDGDGPLDQKEAIRVVNPLQKRAAILDMVSEVYSASQIQELEGEDDELSSEPEED